MEMYKQILQMVLNTMYTVIDNETIFCLFFVSSDLKCMVKMYIPKLNENVQNSLTD